MRDVLRSVFFVSLPAFVAICLLTEASLRFIGYVPYYLDGDAFVPSANPNVIYEPRPGFSGLYAGVPISINSEGFRGGEATRIDDDSTLRIVVVGDSIAFGQGVRDEETLSVRLQTRLRRQLDRPVVVVNMGVPGYNTCQEYARFEAKGLAPKTQIALLLYYENDTEMPVFHVRNATVVSPDTRVGWFGELMASARKKSLAYNLIWTRWQVLKEPAYTIDQYRSILTRKFTEGSGGWDRSKACLRQLVSLARRHSVRMIVVPFPVLGTVVEPYPFKDYIAAICEAARASEAECLDVVPALAKSGIRFTISSVETHPSADVYRLIADQIGEALSVSRPN